MDIIELFINSPVNAKLDMDQAFTIALQYSVADIRDISKRNAAYSKTISLPGTKNNNFWFGNLFDINSDFTMFNPNKKTDAKLLVNGEIVIDGFLQLRKINKDISVDAEGNGIIYECVLYNNFIDLMTELGEKTLFQLDLEEYNHVYSLQTVTQSWEHTWEDGYVYPMYGTHLKDYQYTLEDFKPNLFYKAVFNKVLESAGYGWTGSFRNNEQFSKEIISFVKDGNEFINETERRRRLFRAGISPKVIPGPDFANAFGNQQLIVGSVSPYDDDTTGANFDNDNHWNTTLYEWDVDRVGTYDLNINLSYKWKLLNNTIYNLIVNPFITSTPPNYFIGMKFTHKVEKWNGSSWNVILNPAPYNFVMPSQWSGTSYSVPVTFQHTFNNIYLNTGEKIRVKYWVEKYGLSNVGYSLATQTAGKYMGYINSSSVAPVTLQTATEFTGTSSFIFNNSYANEGVVGDTLDVGNFLPDKIKQKDIIADLIKRYNLYIEVDPSNEKLLVITERPNFYSNQSPVLDWTYKKDFSQKDNIQLLSDLQFKNALFSYSADTDDYNKIYSETTGDVYGQYEWTFDNDFVKGEKKIESSFAATPIVKTLFKAYVAAIDTANPKIKQRINYWGGLKNYSDPWKLSYFNPSIGTTASITLTSYPYAGHFDDPINPQLDINFGNPKFMFYNEWQQLPIKNMYNTYWSNYIKQIEDGRLVTSYFNLNETDIRFIKDNFDAKIFIKDSYYYVNKIIDYKPLSNMATQVELIKINDGIKFDISGNAITQGSLTASCPNDMVAKRFGDIFFYVSASGAEVTEACCESIGGIWTGKGCRVRKKPILRPITSELILKDFTQMWGEGNLGNAITFGSKNISPNFDTIIDTESETIVGPGLFVTLDEGGYVLRSEDGVSWTQSRTPPPYNDANLLYITETSRLIAADYTFTFISVADYPFDTWTSIDTGANGIGNCLGYSPKDNRVIGIQNVGEIYNAVAWSDDNAITWATASWPTYLSRNVNIVWNNDEEKFVAVGGSVSTLGADLNVAFSDDGINWVQQTPTGVTTGRRGFDLQYIDRLGIYLETRWVDFRLRYSTDAIDWQEVGATSSWLSIAWSDDIIVCMGLYGDLQYSTDGLSWTTGTTPYTGTSSLVIRRVNYSPYLDKFVAVGEKDVLFLESSDGINWATQSQAGIERTPDIIWVAAQGPDIVVNEYEFTRPSRGFIVGDYNQLTSDNILLLESDNNFVDSPNSGAILANNNSIVGEHNFLLSGADNNINGIGNIAVNTNGVTISGENITVISASELVATQSNSIYLGNSIIIDSINGSMSIPSISPGTLLLPYGTTGTPSIYWDDSFRAGLFKVDAAERGFNAVVSGLTVSRWTSTSMDMQGNLFRNYRHPVVSTTTPSTLDEFNYFVIVRGTASGATVSLPSTPLIGRPYVIKCMNPVGVDVVCGTTSHTIDGCTSSIHLDDKDSVSLIYDGGNLQWLII